jgi:hypothetical protein
LQSLLSSEELIQKRRLAAKQDRQAVKERKRRMDLAAFRDRLRRRKLADGEPIPEDLKEQEWERVLARSQVCGGGGTCVWEW